MMIAQLALWCFAHLGFMLQNFTRFGLSLIPFLRILLLQSQIQSFQKMVNQVIRPGVVNAVLEFASRRVRVAHVVRQSL